MNVLIVGNGSGSWAMRGKQLGTRIGARVTSTPQAEDWRWCDCVVMVKNWGARFAAEARSAGKTIVWDVVDFWRQPHDNRLDETAAKALFQKAIAAVGADLVIGATEAQARAAGGVYVPHHTWSGLEPMAPQPECKRVLYQGNPAYLGRWHACLTDACRALGWQFVMDPIGTKEAIWQADIVVALRDGQWDGWMCREWKSGVKIGNAIAAGRPLLAQPSAALRELGAIHVLIGDEPSTDGVIWTLESLGAHDFREYAYRVAQQKAPALRLPAVGDRYKTILSELRTAA